MTTTAVPARAARGRSASPRVGRLFSRFWVYAVCVVLGFIVLVPLFYVVLGGFRTTGQIAAHPVALPDPWITHNYGKIITSEAFWRQVANSALIAAIATAIIVGLGS